MADIPDWLNKKVTLDLNQQGLEVTPEEVEETRKSAYAKIREHLRLRGIPCPDGDLELLDWMRQLRLGSN